MAKRRRKRTLKARSTYALKRAASLRSRRRDFSWQVSAQVAKEIWAVIYALIGVLTIMSLKGQLGVVGEMWKQALSPVFGYGTYLVPIILFGISLVLILTKKVRFGLARIFGLILFLASTLGTIHLSVPEADIYDFAAAGKYGGLMGFVASFGFRMVLGVTGAYLVLLALFLISLLLTFEVSLVNFLEVFGWFFAGNKRARKKKDMKEEIPEMDIEIDPDELNIIKPEVDMKERKEKEEAEETILLSEVTEPKEKGKKGKNNDFQIMEMEYEWEPPPLSLLSDATLKLQLNDSFLKKNAEIIRNKLMQFGIEVTMNDVHVGPTVIQYTLRPHAAVKLSKITALKNDLALALAAKAVRIEAPIPGKSLVGIEIPNDTRSTVHLRELIEHKDFKDYKGNIKLPLGRDVSGEPVVSSLEKMPHLLIAGATGSGKSVAINATLLSLFYQFSPRELRLILIDPKRVELNCYNSIPHLLTPVVTDVERAVIALRWAVKEMTRRYKIFADAGHRSISEYNADNKIREKLPFIMIVVDEMADLMMTAGKEVEASICRLAQMARAVGMHLILATQRPSVDVVTGLIKANIPARIAFTMSSSIDSRTVLDMMGAEDLLGHGDMLFLSGTMSKTLRVQGVFVSSSEIERVTNHLKLMPGLRYDDSITSEEVAEEKVQGLPDSSLVDNAKNENADPLYDPALRLIMEHRKASASLLQRRLSIGYARAARLLDLLEENGIIGPSQGAKPREIKGIGV